ncbi:hypothetical protein LptCag_1452 [Leptospirillum ferriphilum]|uniref:DUF2274 domain-containing protein n=1 Tax=Leptospirillum ferriphilum TaxID=178606 RepID=A0A094WDL8_9BACT|nr:DUF2274 domain-containing protein [Leptospirillum ferriphilum]KGA93742.1 hypothetical protein LptCag_1452 [Leptospirillum ferriphilum]
MPLNLRLSPKSVLPEKKVSLTLTGDLAGDILLYCDAYNKEYGSNVTPKELVAMMLKNFLDKDRSFQAIKKKGLDTGKQKKEEEISSRSEI